MKINADTKIAHLIKQNPEALEAIISIAPKFEKLRNPLLRKLMAGRTSIGMACKIVGLDTSRFYEKLKPLGFEEGEITSPSKKENSQNVRPSFFRVLTPDKITELDVRDILENKQDPLPLISKTVKTISKGHAMKLINSFEPTPLIALLGKQGFESFTETISPDITETYFYRRDNEVATPTVSRGAENWEEYLNKYKDHLVEIDVRTLEMPGPMLAILDALDKLPHDSALYVYHKRIPVFLLPELKERGCDYRINEVADGEVYLLIFKE
ncbi:MAG: DUF2249 domain-containing protein [Ginsengibacter sp.]